MLEEAKAELEDERDRGRDVDEELQQGKQKLPQRATRMKPEEEEDVRELNTLFLSAKSDMIWDKQVLEKQMILEELTEEEKRLNKMMEIEREKDTEVQEELEHQRKQELMRAQQGIVKQTEQNAEERALRTEELYQEGQRQLERLEQMKKGGSEGLGAEAGAEGPQDLLVGCPRDAYIPVPDESDRPPSRQAAPKRPARVRPKHQWCFCVILLLGLVARGQVSPDHNPHRPFKWVTQHLSSDKVLTEITTPNTPSFVLCITDLFPGRPKVDPNSPHSTHMSFWVDHLAESDLDPILPVITASSILR
ncbi:inner centromere protein-like [Melospiza melodia melodia]|uniref:inner centromere protein-like n=1 Tax=Melospiza melodia melodia TaxID=1914991 RepID=UPI002FD06C09